MNWQAIASLHRHQQQQEHPVLTIDTQNNPIAIMVTDESEIKKPQKRKTSLFRIVSAEPIPENELSPCTSWSTINSQPSPPVVGNSAENNGVNGAATDSAYVSDNKASDADDEMDIDSGLLTTQQHERIHKHSSEQHTKLSNNTRNAENIKSNGDNIATNNYGSPTVGRTCNVDHGKQPQAEGIHIHTDTIQVGGQLHAHPSRDSFHDVPLTNFRTSEADCDARRRSCDAAFHDARRSSSDAAAFHLNNQEFTTNSADEGTPVLMRRKMGGRLADDHRNDDHRGSKSSNASGERLRLSVDRYSFSSDSTMDGEYDVDKTEEDYGDHFHFPSAESGPRRTLPLQRNPSTCSYIGDMQSVHGAISDVISKHILGEDEVVQMGEEGSESCPSKHDDEFVIATSDGDVIEDSGSKTVQVLSKADSHLLSNNASSSFDNIDISEVLLLDAVKPGTPLSSRDIVTSTPMNIRAIAHQQAKLSPEPVLSPETQFDLSLTPQAMMSPETTMMSPEAQLAASLERTRLKNVKLRHSSSEKSPNSQQLEGVADSAGKASSDYYLTSEDATDTDSFMTARSEVTLMTRGESMSELSSAGEMSDALSFVSALDATPTDMLLGADDSENVYAGFEDVSVPDFSSPARPTSSASRATNASSAMSQYYSAQEFPPISASAAASMTDLNRQLSFEDMVSERGVSKKQQTQQQHMDAAVNQMTKSEISLVAAPAHMSRYRTVSGNSGKSGNSETNNEPTILGPLETTI